MIPPELASAYTEVLNYATLVEASDVLGLKALSEGKNSAIISLRNELFTFLLYVGNANGRLVQDQVDMLNFILVTQLTAHQFQDSSLTSYVPAPKSSLLLKGFLATDYALARSQGVKITRFTDKLIFVFEQFGNTMVSFDENRVSKARCDKFIRGLKSYARKHRNLMLESTDNPMT